MRHNGHQIDFIVTHRLCNLRRRFALNNYRLDLQAIKQWISQQVADLSPELQ
jgi:hypothetical protein